MVVFMRIVGLKKQRPPEFWAIIEETGGFCTISLGFQRFDLGVVTASGSWKSPNGLSPQDWVLEMQAQKSGETVKGK